MSAIEIEPKEGLKITVDFNSDLERYRNLDKSILLNPVLLTKEERKKLPELFEICPGIEIKDNLRIGTSTIEEYINGEAWIQSVISGLNPEWSDIQKIAYIDNAIGKKISYTPDFDTASCNILGARALWKIIESGYGVCNGIAQIEKYILDQVEIDSQIVNGKSHSFLKINNIELPTQDGKTVKGNTILDPTWNLAAQRYGAKPVNFCKSYEEIRKNDVDIDGKDWLAHKNDENLENAVLNLDEQSLRQIYASIGLADKDSQFPIKEFTDKSELLSELDFPEEQIIEKQFMLLSKYCPEFATCQDSTAFVLKKILLKNLEFNKCVANRVYERQDKKKEAVLYVYIDLKKSGKKFYYADKAEGQFIELQQEEFEKRFECYHADLIKHNGTRPWETLEKEKEEDLTKSSGKLEGKKGVER